MIKVKKIISTVMALSLLTSFIPNHTFAEKNNLIQNSAFNDLSGWSGIGSGSVSLDTTQNGSGGKGSCLQATMDSGEYYDIRTRATIEPGITYTVSFYAKASDEGLNIQPIRLYESTGGWNYLDTKILSTRWEKYTIEWLAPETDSKNRPVDAYGEIEWRMLGKGTVWLDDITIADMSIVEEEETVDDADYYEPYEYVSEDKKQYFDSFSDTDGHWAEETLNLLKTDGDIFGIDNKSYEPDRTITRAEFLTMLMNQFNLENNSYRDVYSDVTEGQWFTPIIQNAYDLGLISTLLTQDNRFRPNEPIKREDAAVLADSYAVYNGYKMASECKTFSDDSQISAYARESVYNVCKRGIICGYEDGSFRPLGTLTRAEAAQILMNVLECSNRLAIYVDPENGNDANNGRKSSPIKTFKQMQRMVRTENKDMKHNLYVFIKAGEYFIDKSLEFDTQDSGTNGCSIIYTSYGDGQAVLSGGLHISPQWQVDNDKLGIYKTYVGSDTKTRQLYVNGIRMIRARTESGFKSKSSRINDKETGYITGDTEFLGYRDIGDMELVYYKDWTNPRCGVDKLERNADGTLTLLMESPCWTYLMGKAHLRVENPRWFENQYEFLDEEGEWYLDKNGWLYYKPFSFIDLNNADVVIPTTETLVTVTGSKAQRVENISFLNLGFKYATWMRPSTGYGYTDAQGGRIREGQDKVPDASVWIKYTKNVSVRDCTFSKLGLSALNVTDWVEDVKIVGNHIYDISGCGMYVGNHGTDGGASGDGYLSQNITISNNLVHDYGIDYSSSDGIEGMTMSYATASHNEIYNSRYSGLVFGYGAPGTRFAIDYVYNYVHDVLNENIYDGGSIYVTQETNGTSDRYNQMAYNYVAQQGNVTGVLYPDNNSTYWEVHHNVVDQTRKPYWYRDGEFAGSEAVWMFTNGKMNNLLHSNYATNKNYTLSGRYAAPGIPEMEVGENYCYPDADWPQEARDIIKNAGLEPEYEAKYPGGIEVIDLKNKELSMKLNDEVNAYDMIVAYGRKDEQIDASSLKIACSADRPDIIEISPDGIIKSTGVGKAIVVINVINGDILYTKRMTVYSGDNVANLDFGKEKIRLYEGTGTTLSGFAKSELGGTFELDSIEYAIGDENIATVDETGTVSAVKAGNTTLDITAECKGETVSVTLPVEIKTLNDSEGFDIDDYLTVDFDSAVTNEGFWSPGSTSDIFETTEEGTEFKTPKNTIGSVYKYQDELIHTKIKINAEGGWPSLAVRCSNNVNSYSENTEYMVTFEQNNLVLQKFVSGERNTFNDLRLACEFEYGKEYDVHIGAVNHEDCVEIIVCINGVPYMRFKDYDEDRITDEGYVQVYCRAGSIELLKTK